MDRIDKALQKLSEKERARLKDLISLISQGRTGTLDIKKLKGQSDIFRARKGDIRVLYRMAGKQIFLLAIERRNDNTYKDL